MVCAPGRKAVAVTEQVPLTFVVQLVPERLSPMLAVMVAVTPDAGLWSASNAYTVIVYTWPTRIGPDGEMVQDAVPGPRDTKATLSGPSAIGLVTLTG
jgi:hypothetical protein